MDTRLDCLRGYELLFLLHSLLDEDPTPDEVRAVVLERNELAYRMLRGSLTTLPDSELRVLQRRAEAPLGWDHVVDAEAEIRQTQHRAIQDEAQRRRGHANEGRTATELEADARKAGWAWMDAGHALPDLFRYLRCLSRALP